MLEIIEAVNLSPEQYRMVIQGMRNPHNSWYSSDSEFDENEGFVLGENDRQLMRKLSALTPEHAKFRRMMYVWVTINAPLYWWKQFDTYKVGTVSNSCSTMHRIAKKPFVMSDFSHDYMSDERIWREQDSYRMFSGKDVLERFVIPMLNRLRLVYLETKSLEYWHTMIQLLPSSYNQRRTISLSYEVLSNIYRQRNNHKLPEWVTLCEWMKTLPYSELITLEVNSHG